MALQQEPGLKSNSIGISNIFLGAGINQSFIAGNFKLKNNLVGSLPLTIGQWTELKKFSVTFNRLTGTLPSSIVQWTKLESISIFNNSLTGPLPESIDRWTNLNAFVARHNKLTGSLPKILGAGQHFNGLT